MKIYDMLSRSHFCALEVTNQEMRRVLNGLGGKDSRPDGGELTKCYQCVRDGWNFVGNGSMAFYLSKRIKSFHK